MVVDCPNVSRPNSDASRSLLSDVPLVKHLLKDVKLEPSVANSASKKEPNLTLRKVTGSIVIYRFIFFD